MVAEWFIRPGLHLFWWFVFNYNSVKIIWDWMIICQDDVHLPNSHQTIQKYNCVSLYQCHQQTAFKTSLIDWANEIQMVVADGVVVMDMKFWMQACVTLGFTASILIQHSTCVTPSNITMSNTFLSRKWFLRILEYRGNILLFFFFYPKTLYKLFTKGNTS